MKYLLLTLSIFLGFTQVALGQEPTTSESSWLTSVTVYFDALAQLAFVVMIAATIIVRLTPSTADDEAVAKWKKTALKYLGYLPTIGINPNTKKLKEALEDMKKKQ